MRFLDKYLLVDPSFGFTQPRRVQASANLRKFFLVSPNKLFNVQFRLPVYDIREARSPPLGRELDAWMNAHYDGTPFTQEWPQHLDTFENATVTLTEAAAAGVASVKADMSTASPVDIRTAVERATATLRRRVLAQDAAGEWDWISSRNALRFDNKANVTWDDAAGANGLTFRLSASNYATVKAAIRAGDSVRFTQGDDSITWLLTRVTPFDSINTISVSFVGAEGAFEVSDGSAVIGNTVQTSLTFTRESVARKSATPLLPGRYVAFAGHSKLYMVTSVAADGFAFSPALYAAVDSGAAVLTRPRVPCRVMEGMDISQTYRNGAQTSRVVAIEEAYPDG